MELKIIFGKRRGKSENLSTYNLFCRFCRKLATVCREFVENFAMSVGKMRLPVVPFSRTRAIAYYVVLVHVFRISSCENDNYTLRSAVWTLSIFTHLSDRWSEGINLCPRFSHHRSECIAVHTQSDSRGGAAIMRNAVRFIIIIRAKNFDSLQSYVRAIIVDTRKRLSLSWAWHLFCVN